MTQSLGQLLWTGVVERNIPGQRKGWRLSMSIASGPDAWRAGVSNIGCDRAVKGESGH
jgi:hypothetical protein